MHDRIWSEFSTLPSLDYAHRPFFFAHMKAGYRLCWHICIVVIWERDLPRDNLNCYDLHIWRPKWLQSYMDTLILWSTGANFPLMSGTGIWRCADRLVESELISVTAVVTDGWRRKGNTYFWASTESYTGAFWYCCQRLIFQGTNYQVCSSLYGSRSFGFALCSSFSCLSWDLPSKGVSC